jgi:hypothetical protein
MRLPVSVSNEQPPKERRKRDWLDWVQGIVTLISWITLRNAIRASCDASAIDRRSSARANPALLYWRIDKQSQPHLQQPGKKPISLFHICRWIFLFFTVSTASHVYASVPAFVETPAEDGGGPGIVLVTIFPRPVAKQPCHVNLGESVELLVQNLDGWLTKLKDKRIVESTKSDDELVTEQLPKLRLFIDGRPMRTLQPAGWYRDDNSWPWHGQMAREEKERHRYFLRFYLTRDGSDMQSKADWNEVLKGPGLMSEMDLTVGWYGSSSNGAATLPSWIRRGETDPGHVFIFHRVASDFWLIIGLVLLVLAVGVFMFLVFLGGLIREPALPIRDDGLPPVSLGRCQMAFWFFLVITGFFFLWLITGRGDLDTINPRVLTLMGISTATALGAAFITSNTADPVTAAKAPARNYPADIRAAKGEIKAAQAAKDQNAVADAKVKVGELKKQLKDWRKLHWNQWILDLLSEENDMSKPQIMSFHRFQIIVWTLVLGVVFCSEVLTKLGMPNFDSTLLILMGISSGTYLGFKFPPVAKS